MCLKSVDTERKTLFAGYESGDIILWDLETSKMISKLNVHKEPGNKICPLTSYLAHLRPVYIGNFLH